MRRQDRLMPQVEAFSLLQKGEYGILSTASATNEPYGVPVNYCVIDESIYFHCAATGKKIENITATPRVSFCVVGETEIVPADFGTKYESCIVTGLVSEAFGAEKQLALEGLVRKYSAQFIPQGLRYIEKFRDKARVFRISIQSIFGKANKA